MYAVSIDIKCKYPALLAEAIYTKSAHQRVVGLDKIANGYNYWAAIIGGQSWL